MWHEGNYGLENICIGVTERRLPRSRYILLEDHGRVTPAGEHMPGHVDGWRAIPGYISYSRARLRDIHTDVIIAERKFYFYYPTGARYVDLIQDQCEVTRTWSITDVVRPRSRS